MFHYLNYLTALLTSDSSAKIDSENHEINSGKTCTSSVDAQTLGAEIVTRIFEDKSDRKLFLFSDWSKKLVLERVKKYIQV